MADAPHGLDLSDDENKRKSRKGSIPRNVDTYLKSALLEGFTDEISKLSADEPPTKVKVKHLMQAGAFGGTVTPAIEVASRFVKGFADHPGGGGIAARTASGVKELGTATRGDVAKKMFLGAAGATGIAQAQDALHRHQAAEIAQAKGAADLFSGPASGPAGPKVSTPSAPTLGVLRGSSNKGQRVGNTPIAAKSGVVRSMSGQAMNPRANLGDAMRPKV